KVVAPPPARGPGCLGRLIGATFFMFFGILIAVGGLVAVAFLAPELMDDLPKQITELGVPVETPWTVKKPAPKGPALSAVEKAYQFIAAGEYDEAISEVKDSDDEA